MIKEKRKGVSTLPLSYYVSCQVSIIVIVIVFLIEKPMLVTGTLVARVAMRTALISGNHAKHIEVTTLGIVPTMILALRFGHFIIISLYFYLLVKWMKLSTIVKTKL